MAIESNQGDAMVIRAELPGIDSESDIDISVLSDVVNIRAYPSCRPEPRDHPSDVHYNTFVRDIRVPFATVEEVTASYDDGILEVRAPFGRRAVRSVARVAPVVPGPRSCVSGRTS